MGKLHLLDGQASPFRGLKNICLLVSYSEEGCGGLLTVLLVAAWEQRSESGKGHIMYELSQHICKDITQQNSAWKYTLQYEDFSLFFNPC